MARRRRSRAPLLAAGLAAVCATALLLARLDGAAHGSDRPHGKISMRIPGAEPEFVVSIGARPLAALRAAATAELAAADVPPRLEKAAVARDATPQAVAKIARGPIRQTAAVEPPRRPAGLGTHVAAEGSATPAPETAGRVDTAEGPAASGVGATFVEWASAADRWRAGAVGFIGALADRAAPLRALSAMVAR